MAYQPSTQIHVARGATVSEHTEGTVMAAVHAGFYFDYFGFAVSYAPRWVGGTGIASANGLPDTFSGRGWRVRGDTDLPIRFARGLLGLRLTYAYEHIDEIVLGPNPDDNTEEVPGSGASHLAGVTIVGPTHDLGLTLGVTHASISSQMPVGSPWPEASASGWGIGASFQVRFVPQGAYLKYAAKLDDHARWAFNFGCSTTPSCERKAQGVTCTYTC